jgi:hypothetical protein
MNDPKPSVSSIDGSTWLRLLDIRCHDDPRMDFATFEIDGPELHAFSKIDAYLLEDFIAEARLVLAETIESASTSFGDFTIERRGSAIRVELNGGTYQDGRRGWFCGFEVAKHAVAAFVESLAAETRAQSRTDEPDDS